MEYSNTRCKSFFNQITLNGITDSSIKVEYIWYFILSKITVQVFLTKISIVTLCELFYLHLI